MVNEAQLQQQVADYLRLQYPDVLFHSDYGSGVKLTPAQAAIQKRQNGGRRAWPDMFIAKPRDYLGDEVPKRFRDHFIEIPGGNPFRFSHIYRIIMPGLFLELKKEGTRLKKKNGEWATEHIKEQAEMLSQLRQRGYCAEFAVGFDEAKEIVNAYLGNR